MKKICQIYKSSREDEMYLYVDHQEKLTRVPKPLIERMGKLNLVTTLVLTPEKKLARADSAKVIQQIIDNGFYLQMPPAEKDSPLNAEKSSAGQS